MRLFLVLLAVVVASACVAPATPEPVTVNTPSTLRVRSGNRIITVTLEQYVLGSALAEVSPVGEAPATVTGVFELQAILARTYAVAHLGRHRDAGFDLCDTTHCQIYEPGRIATSRFADTARQAVARTAGVILVYSGHPANALYHSDCGGHTAAADVVWGGAPVAYLTGTKDDVPASVHRKWTFEAPLARLRAALNADPKSAVGRRLDRITIVGRDASGRATSVEARGEYARALKGEELRAILNHTFGDRAIMSTRFSVSRSGTTYEFTGTGFGHGVGLCQVGAMARVRRGEPAALILASYFPGTSLAGPGRRPFGGTDNPVGFGGVLLLESP